MQNLATNFTVGAGDYLAFAGIGPYYPQQPNDAVGSDATYESSSKPNTFTAIPPTAGQTFTVGAHGDANTTYDIGPDLHGNQGRAYGIGVDLYGHRKTATSLFFSLSSIAPPLAGRI